MAQQSIEAILRQKLGLDTNSVGSRLIERAVQQRQQACGLRDRAAYLERLQASPQELDQIVEAVVIPETWFFRDRGPFDYLRQFAQQLHPSGVRQPLRLLSVPCSTGEEPYSMAITLLEAGLSTAQFHIDAVDISQRALAKARCGLYRKKSFRGAALNSEPYFQRMPDGYQVEPMVRKSICWIHGNILEPDFLAGKLYDVIFCRNLLIYLDNAARLQVIASLDAALKPQGLLFLGAVETPQITNRCFKPVPAAMAFAFQKQSPLITTPVAATTRKPVTRRATLPPPQTATATDLRLSSTLPSASANQAVNAQASAVKPERDKSAPSLLETAKRFADRGELTSAAQLCQSYLRVHPTQASAHLLMGEIYQALNQLRSAEQCLQKAVYLAPDSYEALIHLALLKDQQGDHAEADRLKRRARRLVHLESQPIQGES